MFKCLELLLARWAPKPHVFKCGYCDGRYRRLGKPHIGYLSGSYAYCGSRDKVYICKGCYNKAQQLQLGDANVHEGK